MIEKAVVCMACTVGDEVVEFPNMLELKKHEMLGHTTRHEKELLPDPRGVTPSATELKAQAEKKQEQAPIKPEKPIPLIPLTLKYKYEGQCEKCRDHVKTIEMEMEGYNVIICYCVRCDKKLSQQKVIPIEKQFKQEIKLENMLKGKK